MFTEDEKKFLVELLSKLTFGIDTIEQAQIAKNIVVKLQNPIIDGILTPQE